MSLSRRGFLGSALAGLGFLAVPASLRKAALAPAVAPVPEALPAVAPVYYDLTDPEVTAIWSEALHKAVMARSWREELEVACTSATTSA